MGKVEGRKEKRGGGKGGVYVLEDGDDGEKKTFEFGGVQGDICGTHEGFSVFFFEEKLLPHPFQRENRLQTEINGSLKRG